MIDYGFQFSNAQALGTLTSTGVVSDYVWNLEDSASGSAMNQTDMMVYGWVNFIILSSTNTTGNNLRIILVSSSTAALTGTLEYLGGTELLIPEIITGYSGSFGVCRAHCEKFVGIWYDPSTTLTGATSVDCWFSETPINSPKGFGSQKRPNASFA